MLIRYSLAIISVCLNILIFSCHLIKDSPEEIVAKDSVLIVNNLQQSANYIKVDKAIAKIFAEQAFMLADTIKNLRLSARSLLAVANSERFKGDINNLFKDEKVAITIATNSKNDTLLFECLNAYANDLIALSRFDESAAIIDSENNLPISKSEIYKARLLNTAGYLILKQQKSMTDAKVILNKSLDLAYKTQNAYLVAKNKLFLFRAMLYSGLRDSTSNYGFEALHYFEKNNYYEDAAYCDIEIANNYRFLADLNKSIGYANEAYALMTTHQNHLGAALSQNILFQNYLFQKKMPEAKRAVDLLYDHYTKLNFENGIGTANILYGAWYSANGEYAKADTFFKNADVITSKLNVPLLKSALLMFESQHFQVQNKTKEADSVALLAYALAQQSMPKELLKNIYSANDSVTLSKSQALDKRLFNDSDYRAQHGKEALQALRKDSAMGQIYKPVLSAFDSGLNSAYNKQILELETQYKTKQKDDSLFIANQNILLAKSNLQNKNSLLIASVILLLLLSGAFWQQYHNRQRAERDKAKIQLLQNEIHHRVKNNLGIIKRFVEVAKQSGRESLSLESLQSRITAIELLHKNLYQTDKAGEILLQTYLEQLVKIISATFYEEDKNIQIRVNAPVTTNMQTAEKLGLIINELVTNSFKYGFKGRTTGEINITASPVKDDKFTLHIEENGIGYNKESVLKGYGSKLIEGIAYELNAVFNMSTTNGVSFNITV